MSMTFLFSDASFWSVAPVVIGVFVAIFLGLIDIATGRRGAFDKLN